MSINVNLLDGKGYIYDEEDAKRLRVEHRIVGVLVGNLTSKNSAIYLFVKCLADTKGESADSECLPLVLGPEEMALSLKRGWITLTRPLDAEEQGDSVASTDVEDAIKEKQSTLVELASRRRTRQVSPWTRPPSFVQRLHCAVFEDLHSKGFFLTSGVKFGGDWLVYPGDPLVYHAQFVVRVVTSSEKMSPLFFVAAAREAHAARKHLLLVFADQERSDGEFDLRYITVAPHEGFSISDGNS